jgi:hypothetical protein
MSQIVLTSDTLASPATAGAIEYTSPVIYATPVGTQRGVMPNAQFYRLNADYVGTTATTAQGIFGVGTSGTGLGVTLSSGTVYAFETYLIFSKTATATAHNFQLGFAGTATLNNILYGGPYTNTGAAFTSGAVVSAATFDANTAAATTSASPGASAAMSIRMYLRGTVSVNAGGTFIPQYTTSAAVGPYSTLAGSYFLIYPIGASGAAINVGTWS